MSSDTGNTSHEKMREPEHEHAMNNADEVCKKKIEQYAKEVSKYVIKGYRSTLN